MRLQPQLDLPVLPPGFASGRGQSAIGPGRGQRWSGMRYKRGLHLARDQGGDLEETLRTLEATKKTPGLMGFMVV